MFEEEQEQEEDKVKTEKANKGIEQFDATNSIPYQMTMKRRRCSHRETSLRGIGGGGVEG